MEKPTSYLIIFITCIILVPRGNGSQTSMVGLQGNCSYLVEIETSCAPSAETTDTISVRFSDSAGNLVIVRHLKNPKLVYAPKGGLKKPGSTYGGFARCAIDMFEASGACMGGRVCALYVKRLGSDGWRPGWVRVLHPQGGAAAVPVSYVFYFRKFVPGNVWYGFDYCKSREGFVPHVTAFG